MRKKKRLKRHKGRNRHHNINVSRGGGSRIQNLILLKEDRHFLLHYIFQNRTLKEIICVLQRLDRAKTHQHG